METCKQRPLLLKGRKDHETGDQSIKKKKEKRKKEEEMRAELWKLRVFR